MLGIAPETRVYEGDNPAAFVISLNLKRRHLSESQRAMIAARLANIERGGDRGNQHTGGKSPIGGLPQSEAAELLNVSPKSVERAKSVQTRGIPELQKAVEQGEVAVHRRRQGCCALRPRSAASCAGVIFPEPLVHCQANYIA